MLWDLKEGKRLYSLDAGDIIHSLVFSPNRYWLCAATTAGIKVRSVFGAYPIIYHSGLHIYFSIKLKIQFSKGCCKRVYMQMRSDSKFKNFIFFTSRPLMPLPFLVDLGP